MDRTDIMAEEEKRPLLNGDPDVAVETVNPGSVDVNKPPIIKLYKRRWYILLLFSFLTFTQGGVWNTFGPIADSAESAFGWNDADIALLTNWGPITYVISTLFFSWLVDVKGLRWATLITAALVFFGTGIRCITSDPAHAKWLINLGHALNGFAGPIVMGAPPVLSVTWFPPHERTTATAISTVFGAGFGTAVSFVIGPLLVRELTNNTLDNSTTGMLHNITNHTNTEEVNAQRQDIMKLMYIEFGFMAVLMLLILIYFPAKPPSPPSISAATERMEFKKGLSALLKHWPFWLVAAPYAIAGGVYNCWSSVIDVNLKPLGIKQTEAGWIGFYATMAGSAVSLCVARFADVFSGRMKTLLICLYFCAVGAMAWFLLLCNQYIPFNTPSLYISTIMVGVFIMAATPLFYELCCELSYPIAEGITNLFLTMLNNVTGLIFLLVFMIPHVGTMWMNWFMIGSIIVCLPILFIMKEKYSRLDIDEQRVAPPEKGPDENILN
ncbi:unnamed protein product [Owenia fusiformis]|uniref:Uncharacterized protein n=1 Tax=Owenia fusiformis TaxID=6347 RepID=A0A8J1Y0K6_OWEFU|nr:unnamed protein product [Owenia fusiformis]